MPSLQLKRQYFSESCVNQNSWFPYKERESGKMYLQGRVNYLIKSLTIYYYYLIQYTSRCKMK
jgi:hypothetical protein